MAMFRVEIDTDNAAFHAEGSSDLAVGTELVRILEGLARIHLRDLSRKGFSIYLRDINGNTVGKAWTE